MLTFSFSPSCKKVHADCKGLFLTMVDQNSLSNFKTYQAYIQGTVTAKYRTMQNYLKESQGLCLKIPRISSAAF